MRPSSNAPAGLLLLSTVVLARRGLQDDTNGLSPRKIVQDCSVWGISYLQYCGPQDSSCCFDGWYHTVSCRQYKNTGWCCQVNRNGGEDSCYADVESDCSADGAVQCKYSSPDGSKLCCPTGSTCYGPSLNQNGWVRCEAKDPDLQKVYGSAVATSVPPPTDHPDDPTVYFSGTKPISSKGGATSSTQQPPPTTSTKVAPSSSASPSSQKSTASAASGASATRGKGSSSDQSSSAGDKTPKTTASQPSAHATSGSTSQDSSNQQSSEGDDSKKTNTGTIAGAVVGAIAGIGAIGFAAWFFMRRRKANSPAELDSGSGQEPYGDKSLPPQPGSPQNPFEAPESSQGSVMRDSPVIGNAYSTPDQSYSSAAGSPSPLSPPRAASSHASMAKMGGPTPELDGTPVQELGTERNAFRNISNRG